MYARVAAVVQFMDWKFGKLWQDGCNAVCMLCPKRLEHCAYIAGGASLQHGTSWPKHVCNSLLVCNCCTFAASSVSVIQSVLMIARSVAPGATCRHDFELSGNGTGTEANRESKHGQSGGYGTGSGTGGGVESYIPGMCLRSELLSCLL